MKASGKLLQEAFGHVVNGGVGQESVKVVREEEAIGG